MQGFGNYCSKMQTNQTLTLKDTRDNNSYTVAKLLDGRCWMTQNLRIQNFTLTPNDSDIDAGQFVLAESGWKPSSARNSDLNDVYISQNVNYGGFYSWFTATAGQGNTVFINSAGSSRDATNSICPKGWKMPSKNNRDQLFTYYTLSTIRTQPANFTNTNMYVPYGANGNTDGILANNSANNGHTIWTRTAHNSSSNEIIDFFSGGFWPHRDHGLNIRCISML